MLEMLVEDQPLRAGYIMIEARIPSAVKIDRVRGDDLPSDWRDIDARAKLHTIGAGWARKRSAAVLAVPSAIVPAESNYLLNPLHPAFKRITVGKPSTVETDLRLISGRRMRSRRSAARYGNPASRASLRTNAVSSSAFTSETASQSIPDPVACATLKPRTVRSADGGARAVSGRTYTSMV